MVKVINIYATANWKMNAIFSWISERWFIENYISCYRALSRLAVFSICKRESPF